MRIFTAALLGFLFAYILTVGFRPLASPDEFRYGEIAREMEVSGDRLSPRLLDLRYYEKPVMVHQLNWLSLKIFGKNALALRLSGILLTALTGAMTAALVWRRRRDGKLVGMTFGFYASFLWVYILGTTALTDAPLTFFTTATLFCGFLAIVEGESLLHRLGWCVLAALAAVGGFFTKGAVAIALPGLSLFGFILWEKRYRDIYRVGIPILLIAGLAALPLGLAVHRADPDFWRYFLWVEHFQRFTAEAESQHPEPWYFLLPFLLLGALPGLIFLPCWIKIGRASWGALLRYPIYKLSLCAVVLPMIFLSCSSGKLPTYILPCFPLIAILFAGGLMTYLREYPDHRLFNGIIRFFGVMLVVVGVLALVAVIAFRAGVCRLVPDAEIRAFLGGLQLMIAATGVAGIVGGALILSVRHCRRTTVMIAFFLSAALLSGAINLTLPDTIAAGKFPGKILREFRAEVEADRLRATIVATPALMQAVAWSFDRADIRVLGSVGELDYGEKMARQHGEPTRLISRENLLKLIAQPDRAPVIIISHWDTNRVPKTPQPPRLDRQIDELRMRIY